MGVLFGATLSRYLVFLGALSHNALLTLQDHDHALVKTFCGGYFWHWVEGARYSVSSLG